MPDTGGNEAANRVVATAVSPDRGEQEEQGLMAWLRNLTLKSKLLLMLLPIGLLSMGTQAILGHISGRKAMLEQGTDQVIAVRQSKSQQVESFLNGLRDTFPIFGDNVAVVSATAQFREAFGQLGRTRIADERREKLAQSYRQEYLPALAAAGGEQILLENVWPRTDRGIEAQTLFIAENPFKQGERAKLLDHKVSNPYTLAHYTYHPWFRDVMQRLKLYDLMLVDADTGGIIYSVEKEPDFGTSLIDGPYANTNVGRLFRRVLAEHKKGFVALSDFEIYTPSSLVPAMFIATPVYANFKLTGVLIGQISVAELNRALNGQRNWKADGLGETGLVYIAGSQQLLRSDHRMLIDKPDNFASSLRGQGFPEASISAMLKAKSSILRLPANVESVQRAARGETGTLNGRNILGRQSIQAFTPLKVPDLNWVMVAQVNEDEVLESVNQFQRQMMILACALALATALASMWLAARFLRPVTRLMAGISEFKSGKTDVRVEKTSDDEFGQLTDGFNAMTDTLKARDAKIAEKSEGSNLLLARLFPPSIAERMIKGESQIVDSVSNVTVIYASVIGFVKAVEGKTPVESMALLNEIFDVFDAQAEEHGVDRVKTIGEHYIAVCGLSEARLDHAQRAVAFCDGVTREIVRLGRQKDLPLNIRASLASGDINAGLVGDRRFVFEIWGRPLNYARRLIHDAPTGELRITDATYTLLGQDAGFTDRPTVEGRTLGPIKNYGRRVGDAQTIPKQLVKAAE